MLNWIEDEQKSSMLYHCVVAELDFSVELIRDWITNSIWIIRYRSTSIETQLNFMQISTATFLHRTVIDSQIHLNSHFPLQNYYETQITPIQFIFPGKILQN
jgi:hypothetical protein